MSDRTLEYYLKCIHTEKQYILIRLFSDSHNLQFVKMSDETDLFFCNHCDMQFGIPNKIIENDLREKMHKELDRKTQVQSKNIPKLEDLSPIQPNLEQTFCRYCRNLLQHNEPEQQQGFHEDCHHQVGIYQSEKVLNFLKQLENILDEPIPHVKDIYWFEKSFGFPAEISVNPSKHLNKVVFPAPLGPTRPTRLLF